VWLLGPLVKASSFQALFLGMAVVAAITLSVVAWLPAERAQA
jgi:hypothetical protein